MKKEKPSFNIHFPAGDKVQPKGFEQVGVNETVTVTIKGKITRLEQNAEQYAPGKHFSLEVSACEIAGAGKSMSLSKALQGAQKRVG